MLIGRIVSGIVNYVLLTVGGSGFVFAAFITSTFVKAVPGVIIQLILIPAILKALEYANKGKVVVNE